MHLTLKEYAALFIIGAVITYWALSLKQRWQGFFQSTIQPIPPMSPREALLDRLDDCLDEMSDAELLDLVSSLEGHTRDIVQD